MAIYKNKDIETNIKATHVSLGNIGAQFYTEDENSASIRIYIKHNDKPVNLATAGLTPILSLSMQDGSYFENEPVDIVLAEQGLIQYKIRENVIKHVGKVKATLILKSETQSLHASEFSFTILSSGLDEQVAKEINIELIDDIVKNIMTDNAMGLLDDEYKEKINQDVVEYVASNPDKYKGKDGKSLSYSDLSTTEKEELKSNITDQAVTDFVLEDGSITTDKISDKSLTPNKTTFIYVSDNKFNVDNIELNKSVDLDGSVIADSSRWLSDYIELPKSKKMSVTSGTYRVAIYDKDKKFISRTGITSKSLVDVNTTSNSYYIRISGTSDTSKVMLNDGESLLPYRKYEVHLSNDYLPDISFNNLTEVKVHPSQTTYFKQGNNLYNKSDLEKDKTFDTTGNVVSETDRYLTDYIEIDGTKKLSTTEDTGFRYIIYDYHKKPLSGRLNKAVGASGLIDTTQYLGAKYIRLSPYLNVKDTIMLNEGDTVLPYEDFGFTLVSTAKTPIKIDENIVPKVEDGSNGNGGSGLLGTEQIYKEESATLNANVLLPIYDTTKKSQVDYIELSSNNVNTEILITYKDKDGTEIKSNIINPVDNSKLPLTIKNIVDNGYEGVNFITHDPTKSSYKISFNDLNFSNGFKVEVKNTHTSPVNASIRLVGRYYV